MLQWMDNFNIYGTDGGRTARLKNGPYADNFGFILVVDPDPTAGGGQVLQGNAGGTGGLIRKVLTAPQVTVGVACRIWLTTLQLGNGSLGSGMVPILLSDVTTHGHCYIGIDASGYIRVYRQENGGVDTLLGSSDNPVIVTNGWQHIEGKILLDNAAGTVEVRVEGVPVVNIAGVKTTSNLAGAGVTAGNVEAHTPPASSCQMHIKDYIIWDGTGASNNNFMGSCSVLKIIPDADVTLNWNTSAGGTGFNLINEVTPDDDGTYISAPFPLPAGPYECTLSDLPATVTSVRGVMPIHRSRKTDGGDGNLQVGLLSGAVTGLGANRAITTAYTYWWDIFDQDPNTAAAWTRVAVNALHMKLNRTV